MSQLESKITSGEIIEDKALTPDDAFKFLNEDAVDEQAPPEEKVDATPLEKKPEDEEEIEAKEEDPEKELKEIEEDLEELEEPSKEKLEVVAPVRRREILKKYPTLFKDFPYLEKAYYREQQFTQVFPTIDEAKEAYDKSVTLQNFEDDIVGNGNQKNILKLIKDNNPKAFHKVVDDYMENLAEIDEPAYHHVIANLTKHTIKSMWDEGKASRNIELQKAAVTLNQYVFGSSIYKNPVRLSSDEPDAKAAEISNREREVIKTAFEGASTDVNVRVNNYLKSNIEANIDPSKSMTDYTRKNAVKDAIDKINTLIEKDVRFKGLADRLWEEAARNNFSKLTVDKISKAFIARGKSLLTPVVKSVRNEALKGSGRKVKEDEIEPTDTTESGDKPQPERSRSSKPNKAAAIPKGMSSFDYLMQGDK